MSIGEIESTWSGHPTAMKTRWQQHQKQEFGLSAGLATWGTAPMFPPSASVVVGHENLNKDFLQVNTTYRGCVKFDVDHLFEPFVTARLMFTMTDGLYNMDDTDATNVFRSMLKYIALATTDWTDPNNDTVPTEGDAYAELPTTKDWVKWMYSSPDGNVKAMADGNKGSFSIDVTQPVLDWHDGKRPNNGFVLSSSVEDLYGDNTNVAYSIYSQFQLSIESDIFYLYEPSPGLIYFPYWFPPGSKKGTGGKGK